VASATNRSREVIVDEISETSESDIVDVDGPIAVPVAAENFGEQNTGTDQER